MDSEGLPFLLDSMLEVNIEEQNATLTFPEEIESHEYLKPPIISHRNLPANRQPASQVTKDEMEFYKEMFPEVLNVNDLRIHCTACDRHIGCGPNMLTIMRGHPLLRVLYCSECIRFYGRGTFPRDSDGSETFCRWCAQGGQVFCCSFCPNVFCKKCIRRNLGQICLKEIERSDDWACFVCDIRPLWQQRALYHAILQLMKQLQRQDRFPSVDISPCCQQKRREHTLTSPHSSPSISDTPHRLNSSINTYSSPRFEHQPFISKQNNVKINNRFGPNSTKMYPSKSSPSSTSSSSSSSSSSMVVIQDIRSMRQDISKKTPPSEHKLRWIYKIMDETRKLVQTLSRVAQAGLPKSTNESIQLAKNLRKVFALTTEQMQTLDRDLTRGIDLMAANVITTPKKPTPTPETKTPIVKNTSSINGKKRALMVDLTLDDEEEPPLKKYSLPNVNKAVVLEVVDKNSNGQINKPKGETSPSVTMLKQIEKEVYQEVKIDDYKQSKEIKDDGVKEKQSNDNDESEKLKENKQAEKVDEKQLKEIEESEKLKENKQTEKGDENNSMEIEESENPEKLKENKQAEKEEEKQSNDIKESENSEQLKENKQVDKVDEKQSNDNEESENPEKLKENKQVKKEEEEEEKRSNDIDESEKSEKLKENKQPEEVDEKNSKEIEESENPEKLEENKQAEKEEEKHSKEIEESENPEKLKENKQTEKVGEKDSKEIEESENPENLEENKQAEKEEEKHSKEIEESENEKVEKLDEKQSEDIEESEDSEKLKELEQIEKEDEKSSNDIKESENPEKTENEQIEKELKDSQEEVEKKVEKFLDEDEKEEEKDSDEDLNEIKSNQIFSESVSKNEDSNEENLNMNNEVLKGEKTEEPESSSQEEFTNEKIKSNDDLKDENSLNNSDLEDKIQQNNEEENSKITPSNLELENSQEELQDENALKKAENQATENIQDKNANNENDLCTTKENEKNANDIDEDSIIINETNEKIKEDDKIVNELINEASSSKQDTDNLNKDEMEIDFVLDTNQMDIDEDNNSGKDQNEFENKEDNQTAQKDDFNDESELKEIQIADIDLDTEINNLSESQEKNEKKNIFDERKNDFNEKMEIEEDSKNNDIIENMQVDNLDDVLLSEQLLNDDQGDEENSELPDEPIQEQNADLKKSVDIDNIFDDVSNENMPTGITSLGDSTSDFDLDSNEDKKICESDSLNNKETIIEPYSLNETSLEASLAATKSTSSSLTSPNNTCVDDDIKLDDILALAGE